MRRKLALILSAAALALAGPTLAQDAPPEPLDVFAVPVQVREPTEVEAAEIERLVVEAETARDAERFDDAEAAATALIALARATYGPAHPVTASSLNILGQIAFMRGDLDQAEAIFTEGLAVRRAALGPLHPDVAESLSNLASVRSWQGRYAEVPPMMEEAIGIWRVTTGARSDQVAEGLDNLGRAWVDVARYDRAVAAYEEALSIRTELGASGVDRADILRGLGDLATLTGDYATADARLSEALALLEADDAQGLGLGLTLTSLGSLRDRQGRPDDAAILHGRATDVFAAVLGSDHAFVAAGLENTSGALVKMGDFDRGVELQRRALAIRERAQGEDHPETSVTRRSLAATLLMAGLPSDAWPEAERALAALDVANATGLEAARGELVAARAFLASHPDDLTEAMARAERSQARLSAVLGPDHPETLEARSLVADVLDRGGRPEPAADLYAGVAADGVRRLGPAHPRAIGLSDAAARQVEKAGRPDQALAVLRPVLDPARAAERRASPERRRAWRSAVRLMWAVSGS